jgi:hypothetical protein
LSARRTRPASFIPEARSAVRDKGRNRNFFSEALPESASARHDGGMRGLLCVALLALSGCASVAETRVAQCIGGETRAVASMYFGRNIGQTLGVSDENWRDFVDTEVTPRFGDGLTMYDANGQWRDSDTGAIVREPSKVLMLILSDETRDRTALESIADAYKARFQQQAVAILIERDCVVFR